MKAEITREIPHIDGGQPPAHTSLDPPGDAEELRPAGAQVTIRFQADGPTNPLIGHKNSAPQAEFSSRTTVANTVAKPLDNVCQAPTTLER